MEKYVRNFLSAIGYGEKKRESKLNTICIKFYESK
jgi:hypothetical protein